MYGGGFPSREPLRIVIEQLLMAAGPALAPFQMVARVKLIRVLVWINVHVGSDAAQDKWRLDKG